MKESQQPLKSYLPKNIRLAMIDDGADELIGEYDQVVASPPTITVDVRPSNGDDGSQESLPPPPAEFTPPERSNLHHVSLASDVNDANHYETLKSPVSETVTVEMIHTEVVLRKFDDHQSKKCPTQPCCFWSTLFCVGLIVVLVFALVFGVHEIPLNYLNNSTASTDGILMGNVTKESLTATTPPTSYSYTTGAFRSSSSSSSTSAFKPAFATATTTLAPLTFKEMDKAVFGNLSIFLSQNESFVISPFMLNYIVSFIGKHGDATTKHTIMTKFFEVNDIEPMFSYLSNLKQQIYGSHGATFLLNSFIVGDNPYGKRFMDEMAEYDDVKMYASSERRYGTYYNDMIKKNTYTGKKPNFFFDELEKPKAQTAIAFSHVQNNKLQFSRISHRIMKDVPFNGGQKWVNMFTVLSTFQDFEDYRLYEILFNDPDYKLFVVHSLKNNSIPAVDLKDIVKSVKNPSLPIHSTVCLPEISQQNTSDISTFINLSMGQQISIKAPFTGDARQKAPHTYLVDKYYQAIRFDVSAEGINQKPSKEYESYNFKSCRFVNKPFIYGLLYQPASSSPSQEALLYYGAFH